MVFGLTHPTPRRREDEREARHDHQQRGDDGVKYAARGERHADEVVARRAIQIALHGAHSLAAELHSPRQPAGRRGRA